MAEYINRECLLDAMQAEREGLRPLYDNYAFGFEKGILLVKGFPYADVAPVRHGKWIIDGVYVVCSVCNRLTLSPIVKRLPTFTYCPHCGARMDLEVMDNGKK